MTILFGYATSAFALVAVDQLVTWLRTGVGELARKITLHPSLPIAVASAGIATFFDPEDIAAGREIDSLATVKLDTILARDLPKYQGPPLARAIGDYLAAHLRPAFDVLVKAKNIDPEGEGTCLHFYVLGYDGAEPCLERMQLRAGDHVFTPVTDLAVAGPTWAIEAIKGYLGSLPPPDGNAFTLARVIGEAYDVAYRAQDDEVSRGQHPWRTFGGPLNIAIIDRAGFIEEIQIPHD